MHGGHLHSPAPTSPCNHLPLARHSKKICSVHSIYTSIDANVTSLFGFCGDPRLLAFLCFGFHSFTRHLKRFKSTFIRHFLKYHGFSSQQLTANSIRILLFEGLILGPEFKLPPTNLGCFQLSLEPLQRQLHLLQDGTGDNAEGIGQTHSNIDLSSCSHAFPICPRSNFYFLRPPLSCFFPSAPLSANNKNFYKMASG